VDPVPRLIVAIFLTAAYGRRAGLFISGSLYSIQRRSLRLL
jgi:hypothetical protein